MYQSQFIEMFGTLDSPSKCQKISVAEAVRSGIIDKPLDGNHGSKHPKASEYVNSGVPFLMANDFNDGKVDLTQCTFITRERALKLDKGFAKEGDVLLTHKGTVGKTAILHCPGYDFIMLTPQVTYYRPKKGISAEYLKAYFDSKPFQEELQNIASSGSTRAYIGIVEQQKLHLLIPSVEDQMRFTKISKQADKSKFSGLKSQFIEMFGTLDNHPAEYAVKTLRDLSECYAGATPSTKVKEYWDNGSIPWMSSGEVHMEHVTETESKITESGYQQTSTKMVPVHSVVIALAGQGKTRGKVAITEIPLCTNQSLCAIVPSKDIHYEYLYHNLKGRYLELRGMAGDVNGRGGLNLKIVQSIQVIVPPIDEQMKFVAIAQQADKSKQIAFSRAS